MAGLSRRRTNSNPFLSNAAKLPETQSPEEMRKGRYQKILRKLCYVAPIALLCILIISPPTSISFQTIQQQLSQGEIDPVSTLRKVGYIAIVAVFVFNTRQSGMKSGVFQKSLCVSLVFESLSFESLLVMCLRVEIGSSMMSTSVRFVIDNHSRYSKTMMCYFRSCGSVLQSTTN